MVCTWILLGLTLSHPDHVDQFEGLRFKFMSTKYTETATMNMEEEEERLGLTSQARFWSQARACVCRRTGPEQGPASGAGVLFITKQVSGGLGFEKQTNCSGYTFWQVFSRLDSAKLDLGLEEQESTSDVRRPKEGSFSRFSRVQSVYWRMVLSRCQWTFFFKVHRHWTISILEGSQDLAEADHFYSISQKLSFLLSNLSTRDNIMFFVFKGCTCSIRIGSRYQDSTWLTRWPTSLKT